MIKKIKPIFLFPILLFLFIVFCSAISVQAVEIWAEPEYTEVSPGANVNVSIWIDPEGIEVMGAQYDLEFNNTKLNAIEQTSGSFFSHDGASTWIATNTINNTAGFTKFCEVRTLVDYGVTDPGVLAFITFNVTGNNGVCDLGLYKVILSNNTGWQIPDVNISNASIEIVDGICGDLNGNAEVNMGDVTLLGNYIGYPGNPKYNVDEWAADVNHNGEVNMGDVTLLGNYIGYPGNPKYLLDCTG